MTYIYYVLYAVDLINANLVFHYFCVTGLSYINCATEIAMIIQL